MGTRGKEIEGGGWVEEDSWGDEEERRGWVVGGGDRAP